MKNLREIRINNNLTVVEITKWIGISPTYYWQIENKKRRLYYELAVKIAQVFNKKPDEIFYEDLK
jgi:putative transcriptional regulator